MCQAAELFGNKGLGLGSQCPETYWLKTELLGNISEHEIDIDLMPNKNVQKSEM